MNSLSSVEWKMLNLLTTERKGRDVSKLYKRLKGRSVSYGTLYTTFRRLEERELVVSRDDRDEFGLLRWYKITDKGKLAVEEYSEKV